MKRLIALVLIFTACPPVNAQDSAEFDRFFTTRAERRQLNQAREQYTAIVRSSDPAAGRAEEVLSPQVQLKGLLVRSDGSSEIWLNDASTVGKDRLSNEVKSNTERIDKQQVRVKLGDGEHVTLKPGQLYTPDSRNILETYQTAAPVQAEAELLEQEAAQEGKQPDETGAAQEETPEEFDESVLAETDTKIKLLEERIQKLEGQR